MAKINYEQATSQRAKLEQDTFTTHMTTKSVENYSVDQVSFKTGDSFQELFKKVSLGEPKR